MDKKHIIFMGTPQIAADVLEYLLKGEVVIDLVVTQPDKKIGRKQKIEFSPVKKLAVEHDIPVFQPVKIRNDFDEIVQHNADLIVTCAYGQIVPKEVLNAAKQGCVNLHGSLLPAYRGGAPIQRAIWDGLDISGMTLMKMAEKMDNGPIYKQKTVPILPEDNSDTIFEKMGQAAGILLMENLEDLLNGQADFKEQDECKATFAPVISKKEERIDFSQPDERIANQIRALAMHPGAYVTVKNKKLKILKADYIKEEPKEYLKFFSPKKNELALSLKEGNLYLKTVQMEGKPVMDIKAFYNGHGKSLIGESVMQEG